MKRKAVMDQALKDAINVALAEQQPFNELKDAIFASDEPFDFTEERVKEFARKLYPDWGHDDVDLFVADAFACWRGEV